MTNDNLPTISNEAMDLVSGGAHRSVARGLFGGTNSSMLQWQMMQNQLAAAQAAANDKSSQTAMMVAALAMSHRFA